MVSARSRAWSRLVIVALCAASVACTRDKPRLLHFQDLDFVFHDVSPLSTTVDTVLREVQEGDYKIDKVAFEKGDVIIDVGANVGVISILLAKLHPDVRIYAFEPVPQTYRTLLRNIAANGVTNITAVDKALTGDGEKIAIDVVFDANPGGASSFGKQETYQGRVPVTRIEAESMTLDEVFRKYDIGRCKLLKIDCEGCEYGVLQNTAMLPRIDHLHGEFHNFTEMVSKGMNSEALRELVLQKNPAIQMELVTYAQAN